MLGRDESDPLFLQAKEAEPSVLARFVGAGEYTNQGSGWSPGTADAGDQRHLPGLGPDRGARTAQRDFYVRQLRDWKDILPIEAMVPRGMLAYGSPCGWALARAHACSGDRIAIAAYLADDIFDKAITRFAAAYADQNERDYHVPPRRRRSRANDRRARPVQTRCSTPCRNPRLPRVDVGASVEVLSPRLPRPWDRASYSQPYVGTRLQAQADDTITTRYGLGRDIRR